MKLNKSNSVFFLLLFFLFSFGILDAQQITKKSDLSKKALKCYDKANKAGRNGDFKKSIKMYDKLLKKYPNMIDARLKKAGLQYGAKLYDQSISEFEKAIALDPDYDPLMYYSLAIVYRDKKQYDKAAQYFGEYLSHASNGKKIDRAKLLKSQSEYIYYAINHPVPFDPILLEGDVNTKSSEYMPSLTIEGNKMVFTRRVNGQEDFYIAHLKDNKVINVIPIDDLNTPQNEGVHTISADGNLLIFTACDRRKTGFGSCDLYYARLDSENWNIPKNMGKVVNTLHWDAQPSLSSDGKKLFFSSGRKYGHGGNDIWLTTRTDTSGWTDPVSLPEEINSTGNDESPFIHPDGHTLYFRSNGREGMGGFDIYYSRYIDSTSSWTQAKNIGYPINTEGSEGALTVSLDGKTAYYSSDMAYLEDPKNANLDIYTFDLYEEARPMPTTFVKAEIVDKETGKPIVAQYSIEVLNKTIENISGVSNKSGTFITSLPTDADYAFFVEKEGYFLYSENFKLTGITNAVNPYILKIEMTKIPSKESTNTPITKTEPIVLNNIFFESGSAQLLPASNLELDKLTQNLKRNNHVKIEIHGHTDNVGSKQDNLLLSDQRAKSVADALISRGVESNRITHKGFGETTPIANNNTKEGRQKNRRTEFVLKYN
ncbi:MAG: OmpA family protein [Saprospiraceae bacterium]